LPSLRSHCSRCGNTVTGTVSAYPVLVNRDQPRRGEGLATWNQRDLENLAYLLAKLSDSSRSGPSLLEQTRE
jgi:hypothetical protein